MGRSSAIARARSNTVVSMAFRDAARLRVLAAGMVGTQQQRQPAAEVHLDAVAELRAGGGGPPRRGGRARAGSGSKDSLPSARITRSERMVSSSRCRNGSQRSSSSVSGLLSGGAQRADRRQVDVVQAQPVVDVAGRGQVGVAGGVHRARQEVRRPHAVAAVAGEHAPGAVRAVGGGGQADDQDARATVTGARDRAAPVLVVAVGAAALAGDLGAVVDQAGAEAARGHVALDLPQAGHVTRPR